MTDEKEIFPNGDLIAQSLETATFGMRIAELAVLLAQQAGEEVQRPLSPHQIQRAFYVNRRETSLAMRALLDRLKQRISLGEIEN